MRQRTGVQADGQAHGGRHVRTGGLQILCYSCASIHSMQRCAQKWNIAHIVRGVPVARQMGRHMEGAARRRRRRTICNGFSVVFRDTIVFWRGAGGQADGQAHGG